MRGHSYFNFSLSIEAKLTLKGEIVDSGSVEITSQSALQWKQWPWNCKIVVLGSFTLCPKSFVWKNS